MSASVNATASNAGRLHERTAHHIFVQLASAVAYLHRHNIAHRDLKCENVLLTTQLVVKLADFSFSRYCSGTAGRKKKFYSETYCGSEAYAPPEVLQGIPYQPRKADMWSLGVILYVMMTAALPFEDGNIVRQAMTKHYNLRDRERANSEMNGDGAGNLQAFGVADSGTGGHGSVTSDTASEQQLALLQLQLKIAEAETEKQRLMLESQRLRARNGAEYNESNDSVALVGRSEEDRRLKFASLLKGVLASMPNQEALAPMWFEDVEATLESYEVPSLTAEERKAYVKLKSSILEGLRVSAAQYKRLFAGSKKGERESWDQFAVRLENYFDYYVQSSKVRLQMNRVIRFPRHMESTHEYRNLVRLLLEPVTTIRATMGMVVKHPWLLLYPDPTNTQVLPLAAAVREMHIVHYLSA
ncbi:hypothetical protein HPB51_007420 [Rhipicephalus microplus]|uniref:Protein kinase domain-containing protein n=1 Tax=Rhipicephalus microplus TaxID=6941 RepID=A0A9J6EYD1_RHIMP|nr:hypothetical protein HPB51_007420 [Rhipicephalus microplus]